MVMSLSESDAWSSGKSQSIDQFQRQGRTKRKVRKKYQRKRIPVTERERRKLQKERQAKYEKVVSSADGDIPNFWSFESLFPTSVWDEVAIDRDLYSVKRRDNAVEKAKQQNLSKGRTKLKTSAIGGSSMMRVWREPKLSSYVLPYDNILNKEKPQVNRATDLSDKEAEAKVLDSSFGLKRANSTLSESIAAATVNFNKTGKVNHAMTRLVEDHIHGYRRENGLFDTFRMGEGTDSYREGVRLGNPLKINADRLNYFAKKELRRDRVEEAQEIYEKAIQIDPRDGRAYLGLARCAERRRDFKLARECLNLGIANSVSCMDDGSPDAGANPFLLQALGCLKEKAGHLAEAENLYIEAARSRPSHAAAWVALAQLRTRKFRQGAAAGRACYRNAAVELQKAGLPPSSHVFTAWAAMEYKKAGDVRRARTLFKEALKVDKQCSAAWLQLGVMEANCENWKEAELCYTTVLKFDKRNTRVLQAYALMMSRRPDSDSRKTLALFEKALALNSRDAGVYQAYGLYVSRLGDIESARDL